MSRVRLTIDGSQVEVEAEVTVLEAAQKAGIYIPTLCYHPDLGAYNAVEGLDAVYQGSNNRVQGSVTKYTGCQLCLVEIEGMGVMRACDTPIRDGMVVNTSTEQMKERRQENLSKILSRHPHACLVCPQREGCDLKTCISNVPENQRCCDKFIVCELRKIADYIGISIETPAYAHAALPVIEDEPLFKRDYNLCIGCMRCVRVCEEQAVGAVAFTGVDDALVVGTTNPTLEESGCQFCGLCVEVCPTGALMYKEDVRAEQRDPRLMLSPPVMPPEECLECTPTNMDKVPQTEGVFTLYDAERTVICIKGAVNLSQEMREKVRNLETTKYFKWEEYPMYAKRESELLQQYIQKHGRVPEGNSELGDDLY